MTSREYEALRLAVTGHVAEVTLASPDNGNPIGPPLLRDLGRVFDSLDRDRRVRSIVLSADGAHFSVGFDVLGFLEEHRLHAHLEGSPGGPSGSLSYQFHDELRRAQDAISAPERCRKPVIAAIRGFCRGAAMDLVTACDIRYCTNDARFCLQQVKTAIVPDLGVLQRLPRIVGQGRARELAFSSRNIDAERAERIGLVERVFPDAEELRKGALKLAKEIAANPPLTVQGTKAVLNYSADRPIEDGLRYVAAWNTAQIPSEDMREVLRSFTERRMPKFKGD